MIPWGGLSCCIGGAALCLLGRNSGRRVSFTFAYLFNHSFGSGKLLMLVELLVQGCGSAQIGHQSWPVEGFGWVLPHFCKYCCNSLCMQSVIRYGFEALLAIWSRLMKFTFPEICRFANRLGSIILSSTTWSFRSFLSSCFPSFVGVLEIDISDVVVT